VTRVLDQAAYWQALLDKLVEEADDKRNRRGGFEGKISSNQSYKSDKTATQPPMTTGQLANGRTRRL
jgi:hypothetical protein